jgi:hypothetical protein
MWFTPSLCCIFYLLNSLGFGGVYQHSYRYENQMLYPDTADAVNSVQERSHSFSVGL